MTETGVRLTTHRRFGQSVIMKPFTVEIDGVTVGQARWNRPEFFTTGPGRHRLTVSFPYLWKKRLGRVPGSASAHTKLETPGLGS